MEININITDDEAKILRFALSDKLDVIKKIVLYHVMHGNNDKAQSSAASASDITNLYKKIFNHDMLS